MSTDAIARFKQDETLEELIAAIERDIGVDKPAAAADRLHTYCMKKFAHLSEERAIVWDRTPIAMQRPPTRRGELPRPIAARYSDG